MTSDVVRIDSDIMNRLREHVSTETCGKMYGQIGATVEKAIEDHLSCIEIGSIGEKKAIEYLKKLGFEIIETNKSNHICSYDILAQKENKKFAINVKSAKSNKGLFGIQVSNISRLLKSCKQHNAHMGFLLISDDDCLMLVQNTEYSNWIKPIKSRRIYDDCIGHHYTNPQRQRELTRLRVQRFRQRKKEQGEKQNETI